MAYPKKLPVQQLIIRYKGLFDFDGLYNLMVRWLKARRYWFKETDYKHKVPGPYGAEKEIYWMAEKKINDYIGYTIKMYTHLFEINDVEVIKDGEKKRLMNARLEIYFDAWVTVDFEKRMERSKIWAALADVYYKYFLKEDLESIHHDTLYYRLFRLHNLVKEFLDMEAKGYEYEGYLGDTG